MSGKEKYVEEFERFEASTGNPNKFHGDVAPHKPILLLSLIKLHKKEKVDLEKIDPQSEELLTATKKIWNDWLGYDRDFDIGMPLYYLKRKDFWTFVPKDKENQPNRPNDVQDKVDYFSLGSELIEFMEKENNRKRLIKALLESGKVLKTTGEKKYCFSDEDKKAIREKMGLQISN